MPATLKELRGPRIKGFRGKSAAVKTFCQLPLFLFFPLAAQSAESPTIASTSLCGDSYLLALAPDHISALSWQSRSPLSHASKTQRKLPQLWDDPEALVMANADVILFGAGEGKTFKPASQSTLSLQWGEDFESVKLNAAAIQHALNINLDLENWDTRLEVLKNRAKARAVKPKILYLSRSGGSAGIGTFVDAAIVAAGGENIAKTQGWFTPDPEKIITYQPDLIITSYFKNGYESVQSTAIRNKAVRRFIAKHSTIEIDGKLWPCAGPGLIDAAEQIAGAIDKLP